MLEKNMSAVQLFVIKSQFPPTSDIFATPKLAVRSLDDVRLAKPDKLRNRRTHNPLAGQNRV
jgi:hypothetical protein